MHPSSTVARHGVGREAHVEILNTKYNHKSSWTSGTVGVAIRLHNSGNSLESVRIYR